MLEDTKYLMRSRKVIKRQTSIHKTLHRKLESKMKSTTNRDELRQVYREGARSCSTSGTNRFTVKSYEHHMTWEWCWRSIFYSMLQKCEWRRNYCRLYVDILANITKPNRKRTKWTAQTPPKTYWHIQVVYSVLFQPIQLTCIFFEL